MNITTSRNLILLFTLLLTSCNVTGVNENSRVLIKTTLGDIRIILYDDTPVHRDNFIKLAQSGIYDNILFHRVVKDFMVQSGDPSTSPTGKSAADSLTTRTIPSEFRLNHFHKRGALAAARRGNEDNPDMRSSAIQFYIVQGVKFTDSELDQAELKINSNIKQSVFNRIIHQTADSLRKSGTNPTDSQVQEAATDKIFSALTNLKPYKITPEQRQEYKTSGGTPRLDATYTVFGEVTEGMDVIDRIANSPTDSHEKPLTEIRILKIKILK